MRAASFERVGRFEEEWRSNLFEDQVLLAELFLVEPVFVSDEVWIRYRRHDRCRPARQGRASGSRVGLQYLEWLERYLRDDGVDIGGSGVGSR